jgi:aminoglycoside phosphotransferase (APT) family kinase protein
MSRVKDHEPAIDASLVVRLLNSQFPQWADLPITPLVPGGWDHRSFRLGDDMVVRLPSAEAYATQVEREHRWLPILAPLLPLTIPEPIALGESGEGYPWQWAIRTWIEGEGATHACVSDLSTFARSIGEFLNALHRIDSRDGPPSEASNFFRGGSLTIYDEQARRAIRALQDSIDVSAAMRIWEDALATEWQGTPLWVHGDISAGNLLVRDGRLAAVIDFGSMAVGDPACDLVIAWTFLTAQTRPAFRAAVGTDDAIWQRGRGWALWKASIVVAGITATNPVERAQSARTIAEIMAER